MTEVPNMRVEVLDALEDQYEDKHEDVLVDCLLYLKALEKNQTLVKQLAADAEDKLVKMGRCPKCGERYQIGYYNEWHGDELGYEQMSDKYCPNCDMPFEYNFVSKEDD